MDEADATKARRHMRPNRGKNPNARWIVDEVAKKPATKKRRTAPKHEEPAPILEGETQCACDGAVSDDKTMAECEKCKTWQHVVCEFGVDDESALPDHYECRRCRSDDEDEDEDEAGSDAASDDADARADAKTTGLGSGLAALKDKVRRSVAEAWLKILAPLAAKHEAELSAPANAAAQSLALDLEAALYAAFGDRGAKDPGHVYREQFRMLSFNLKDEKNAKLQHDVVLRVIEPPRFVKMSSAELRPPEMRKLASEIKKESLHESIIPEQEPPKEKVSTATAEVNMEPTFIAVDEEEEKDSEEEDEAMKEPLGPPPTEQQPGTPEAAAAQQEKSPEQPVWEGRVRLGTRLDFAAAGTHLEALSRDDWQQLLENSSSLVIDGAVPRERATEYLKETASNPSAHAIASLVLTSPEAGKTDELYEFLASRDRVGAVEHRSPRVKDAYILPVAGDAAPEFLGLNDDAKAYLRHLHVEHSAKQLLLLTFVLYK